VPIAGNKGVSDKVDPDTARTRLDELIEEAAELREEITAALVRKRHPFFPDRRHEHQPHAVERREF